MTTATRKSGSKPETKSVAAQQSQVVVSRQAVEVVSETVDISQYPVAVDAHQVGPGERKLVALGDVDGNAMKLLHVLVASGVLKMTPRQYTNFAKMYQLLGVLGATDRGSSDYRKWVKTFCELVDKLTLTGERVDLRLIGDVLGDRGENDFLTMAVLRKVSSSPNVHLNVLFSNHDNTWLSAVLGGQAEGGGYDGSALDIMPAQCCSLMNMGALLKGAAGSVDAGTFSFQAVTDFARSIYLPRISLLDYELRDGRIAIYSHAPMPYSRLRALADSFHVQYEGDSVLGLARTIDRINGAFQEKAQQANNRADWVRLFSDHGLLYDFIWERGDEFSKKVDSDGFSIDWDRGLPAHLRDKIDYVHGHVGLMYDATGQLVKMPQVRPHAFNLDDAVGKGDIVEGGMTYQLQVAPEKVAAQALQEEQEVATEIISQGESEAADEEELPSPLEGAPGSEEMPLGPPKGAPIDAPFNSGAVQSEVTNEEPLGPPTGIPEHLLSGSGVAQSEVASEEEPLGPPSDIPEHLLSDSGTARSENSDEEPLGPPLGSSRYSLHKKLEDVLASQDNLLFELQTSGLDFLGDTFPASKAESQLEAAKENLGKVFVRLLAPGMEKQAAGFLVAFDSLKEVRMGNGSSLSEAQQVFVELFKNQLTSLLNLPHGVVKDVLSPAKHVANKKPGLLERIKRCFGLDATDTTQAMQRTMGEQYWKNIAASANRLLELERVELRVSPAAEKTSAAEKERLASEEPYATVYSSRAGG